MTKTFKDAREAGRYFAGQAAWTAPLRRYLYRKSGLRLKRSVLDAGCGTGEVTAEIAELTGGTVTGVDADADLVGYASAAHPGIRFVEAECASMPFEGASFDLVTCHFFIMWLREPAACLGEMARVLEPGGVLLACAEPDYGGLVEYPEHREFWRAIEESLRLEGADPRAGRKLAELLRGAGLGVQVGVSATVWDGELLASEWDARRGVFEGDLEAVLGRERAREVLAEELEQARAGKIVVVPLFWALGIKPQS